ncbi:transient receptor potential cation channel subfamily M member 1-like [Saccostrea cucullata]|uniref:transient receptor potential cation channel subfamily M member 1-like n=1 Tax=Saccostrea cuccullata TaxID=36930 RepID=UPI002ECFD454
MTMEEIFDQTSLHYIFGRNMEEDISKKLWKDLRREMKSTSFPPEIKDGKLKLRNEYSGVNLVFYALLRTKKFVGARQLVEKGCIGIRPILIGTRTLDDLKKEWRATVDFQKEMESLAGTLSQHALSIINYIQEKDERNRHIALEWRIKNLATNTIQISFQEWRSKLKQFFFNEDEKSNKVGRLLLNHGYLEAAYKTENECFLENAKLKTMLKEMWYGEGYKEKKCCDKISYIFLRLFLCIIHIFVMPVMVFSLGLPSWLYQKYHVPILKLWINMAGLVSFLAAFAYMLLFDYTENGISQSEYAVLYWITNKYLDELHQIFVIRCRKSKRKTRRDRYCEYIKNIWNWLDWFIIIFCFVGSAAKYFAESESVQGFAKIMLILSFILLNMRILNMFWTYEFLGTRLVIIQKMAGITVAFMAIMLVIMMCYNVVDYALLYPNTEFTWTEIQNIVKNGYWALYGNFPEDDYSNCTNNATGYEQEPNPRCPTSLGEALSPYLRAIYGFVAIVMLLNLLIAIYTKAYERVDSKSRIYWSHQQSEFLEEYTIRTIFPVHMKGLCLLVLAIYSLVFLIVGKIKKAGHENQRLMRVLFFDETFDDLRTESTEEEIDGMLEVQRDTNTLESEAEDISVKQKRVSEQENTDVKTSIKDLNEKIQFLLTELNTIKSLSAPRGIYTSVKEDH